MSVKKNLISFISSSFSFLMVFAASATPIPLYDIYKQEDGLTYNDLALTAVVYFIGAITALLVFGRISNYLGRKPIAYLVFILTAIACIILINIDSSTQLILGRLLLGIACGLASSNITAYIADTGENLPSWIPSAIISNFPMIGLTIGAIDSGWLIQFAPYQTTLCYLVILAILAICTFSISISKETIEKKPIVIDSFKPYFSLPQNNKRIFSIAAIIFITTWAMGGFYQAFTPSIAVEQLGTHNTLIIGLLFSSYLLASAIGSPFAAKISSISAQRLGMILFTIGVIGIIMSLRFSNITMFILFSVIAGASQGIALTGSIKTLLVDIDIKQRAGILSLIYATSYSGAAITSFIAGQLSFHMNLFHISIFYGVLAFIVCFITLIFTKNSKQVNIRI